MIHIGRLAPLLGPPVTRTPSARPSGALALTQPINLSNALHDPLGRSIMAGKGSAAYYHELKLQSMAAAKAALPQTLAAGAAFEQAQAAAAAAASGGGTGGGGSADGGVGTGSDGQSAATSTMPTLTGMLDNPMFVLIEGLVAFGFLVWFLRGRKGHKP